MNDPPFSYHGGKRWVADVVWDHLGHPTRYIEPFAGGLGVLLGRPPECRGRTDSEVINDKDGLIVNLWRSIREDPETIADKITRIGAEVDLHRGAEILQEKKEELTEALKSDLNYHDSELAAMWLWGKCLWKGSRWPGTSEKRPDGQPGGILGASKRPKRLQWLKSLKRRLDDVVVLCGDWKRCVASKRALEGRGDCDSVGIFLDPPYADADRTEDLYREDSKTISEEVKEWCIEHQDNDNYRIALCGYESLGMPEQWSSEEWDSPGTLSNVNRERIWFSPGCEPELSGFMRDAVKNH